MKEALIKIAYRDSGGMQLLEVPASQLQDYKSRGWTLLNAEPPAPKIKAPVVEEAPALSVAPRKHR